MNAPSLPIAARPPPEFRILQSIRRCLVHKLRFAPQLGYSLALFLNSTIRCQARDVLWAWQSRCEFRGLV